MNVRFYTFLLAALIGLSGLQLAEAKNKQPRIQHVSGHTVKKAKKYKPGKYKAHKQKKAKWGRNR